MIVLAPDGLPTRAEHLRGYVHAPRLISSISVQQSFPPALLPPDGHSSLPLRQRQFHLSAGASALAPLPAMYAYLLVVAGLSSFEAWLAGGGAAGAHYLFFVAAASALPISSTSPRPGGGGISQILSGFYTTPPTTRTRASTG